MARSSYVSTIVQLYWVYQTMSTIVSASVEQPAKTIVISPQLCRICTHQEYSPGMEQGLASVTGAIEVNARDRFSLPAQIAQS